MKSTKEKATIESLNDYQIKPQTTKQINGGGSLVFMTIIPLSE